MALLDSLAKNAGSTAMDAAGRIVSSMQADLTARYNAVLAVLKGHRIRLGATATIEIEEKEAAGATAPDPAKGGTA
jgi:hypothetical protein